MFFFFFFNDTATTEIYTLSLHDALPICAASSGSFHLSSSTRTRQTEFSCSPSLTRVANQRTGSTDLVGSRRSEEHTSELQSHSDLVCRLLLEKKKYLMMVPRSFAVGIRS